MSIFHEATVKFETYEGKVDIEYSEAEGRFNLRSIGSYGGRVVAGMMFGALGRAVYEGIASGKEVGTFLASEIRQVKVSETKKQMVFYLYGSAPAPYEITIDRNTQLTAAIQSVFADRMVAIAAKQPGQQVPQSPQPPVAPPVPSPAAPPPAPPVPQPAVQSPVAPAAQPHSAEIPRTMATPNPQYAASPKPRNALLCLRTGPMAGRNFQCPQGGIVIVGRDPSRCNLALPQYANVSGVHCRMDIGDRFVTVTDLNSTNGTYVKGVRLRPNQSVAVPIGESVMLANEICVFQIFFE